MTFYGRQFGQVRSVFKYLWSIHNVFQEIETVNSPIDGHSKAFSIVGLVSP